MKLISLIFRKTALISTVGLFCLIQFFGGAGALLAGPLADEAKKIAKEAVEFDKLMLDYKDLLDMGEIKQAKNLNPKLTRAANLLTRVKDLSSKIEKLESGSQGHETELKEAKEKVVQTEEQLKNLQAKLEELEKNLSDKEAELEQSRDEARNSQSTLKSYELKNQTAQSNLSSCQAKLQSAQAQADDCKYELTQAKSRLETCEAKSTAAGSASGLPTSSGGVTNQTSSSY